MPDLPGGQRRVSDRTSSFQPARSFDNVSEAGSERSMRRPFDQGDGKIRDFGNWERKGPLAPAVPPPSGPPRSDTSRPMSRDGPALRRNSPAWGEGRSQEGSRPPRREFVERPVPERALTAAEKDSQWRNNMRPDAPLPPPARSPAMSNPTSSTPSSPLAAPATLAAPVVPTIRPKLNLQKRTVSESPSDPAVAPADSKASPFGSARPIDTAAKEKEIEEKRLLALKEKKEAEEKAREEKKIADEKAREEKRLKDAEKAANAESPVGSKDKASGTEGEQNGVSGPPPGKSYEILRRQVEYDAVTADEEGEEGANGNIVDDKSVKPKEIVRDVPSSNGDSKVNGDIPIEPSAEALEEEGWSTVSSKVQKPRKNQRNGNVAARAIAS